MTDLLKPVVRKSAVRDVGRRVVVTLYPDSTIGFRLERTRKEFSLPI